MSTKCRYVHAILTIGYFEFGYAIFQALLELFVCSIREYPLSLDTESVLDLFSAWWDAEHPRWGDNASEYHGFSLSHTPPIYTIAPQLELIQETETVEPDGSQGDEWARWANQELLASARTTPRFLEQDANDGIRPDPYTYVIASDLVPFLFLPASNDWDIVFILLDAFWSSLGFPSHWLLATARQSLPDRTQAKELSYTLSYPHLTPSSSSLKVPSSLWKGLFPSRGTAAAVQRVPLLPHTLFKQTSSDPRGSWVHVLATLTKEEACLAESCLLLLRCILSSIGNNVWNQTLAVPLAMIYVQAGQSTRCVY